MNPSKDNGADARTHAYKSNALADITDLPISPPLETISRQSSADSTGFGFSYKLSPATTSTSSIPLIPQPVRAPPSPPILYSRSTSLESILEESELHHPPHSTSPPDISSTESLNYSHPLLKGYLFPSEPPTPLSPRRVDSWISSSFARPRTRKILSIDNRAIEPELDTPPTSPLLTMASLNPNSAYRLTGQRSVTQEQAKEQQKIIEQKLSRAGQSSPPYDFVDLIGKGSFGRVYLG